MKNYTKPLLKSVGIHLADATLITGNESDIKEKNLKKLKKECKVLME